MRVLFLYLLTLSVKESFSFKACVPFTQCDENGFYLIFGSSTTIDQRFGNSGDKEVTECVDPGDVLCEIPVEENCEPSSSSAQPPVDKPTETPPHFTDPSKKPPHPSPPYTDSDESSIVLPDKPSGFMGCGLKRISGLDQRFGEAFGENGEVHVTRENTGYGEFPWMVAIFKKDDKTGEFKFLCGGSLIEPDVVLTAAHCLADDYEDYKIEDLKVVAGDWDLLSDVEPKEIQEGKIKKTIIHERYNRNNLINDIGLILLEESFLLDEVVDVICLSKSSEFSAKKCRATGWGSLSTNKESKNQILRKVALPLVDHETCQNKLRETRVGRFFILNKSFICAGGLINKDTCKGDGGGPLICAGAHGDSERFAQVGIVSWGIDCGTDTPGVYSSIDYHYHWIEKHVTLIKSREASVLKSFPPLGEYTS